MVSNIGSRLSCITPITGFGYHRRHSTHQRGHGMIRSGLALGTRTLGTFLVNRLANAIAGSGTKRRVTHRRVTHRGAAIRLTGAGHVRRSHVGRPRRARLTLSIPRIGSGYRRKTIRKTHKARTTLSGYGRKRPVHHRRRLVLI